MRRHIQIELNIGSDDPKVCDKLQADIKSAIVEECRVQHGLADVFQKLRFSYTLTTNTPMPKQFPALERLYYDLLIDDVVEKAGAKRFSGFAEKERFLKDVKAELGTIIEQHEN